MPLLLIASLVLLALVPVGAVLLATQVFRRAVDYGLFKPTREMLFTVLNPESKFKSKSLIDTLLQRGGDSAGQVDLSARRRGSGSSGVAWACAGVCVLMLARRAVAGARPSVARKRGPPDDGRCGGRVPAMRAGTDGRPVVSLRAVLALAAPLMVTNVVQAALNLTDTWFLGRLSTAAVAAMSAIYWMMTCIILVLGGVGLAVQTFVAQASGSGRRARASQAAWNAIWASAAVMPLFAAIALAGPWLLRPFHLSPEIQQLALDYWRRGCSVPRWAPWAGR